MNNAAINADDGNDNLHTWGDVISSGINMGDDDDVFTVDGNTLFANVSMGSGDDNAVLRGGVSGSVTNMGSGDNYLEISGLVTGSSLLADDSGSSVLHYNFDGSLSNLTDLFTNTFSGFKNLILDMTNSESDSLDVDSRIPSFLQMHTQDATEIYIKGDDNDTLNLSGWSEGPQHHLGADGQFYDVYTTMTVATRLPFTCSRK